MYPCWILSSKRMSADGSRTRSSVRVNSTLILGKSTMKTRRFWVLPKTWRSLLQNPFISPVGLGPGAFEECVLWRPHVLEMEEAGKDAMNLPGSLTPSPATSVQGHNRESLGSQWLWAQSSHCADVVGGKGASEHSRTLVQTCGQLKCRQWPRAGRGLCGSTFPGPAAWTQRAPGCSRAHKSL